MHALIDGELPPHRARTVEAMIQADATLAARVADYRAQKAMMKQLYGPLIDRPVPQHLIDRANAIPAARQSWGDWRRFAAAAVVALVLAGGGALWLRPGAAPGDVVALALDARTASLPGTPADLTPYNEALSRIMELKVKVPDLSRAGYTLAGVHLEEDAASIAYRDAQGKLVTIYLRQSDGTVRFDQFKRADLRICVWQDDRLSMVMAGDMSAAIMQRLASMAYIGLTA
ncbi:MULTISPECIES: anti-sigma factor [unclassified Azospirillum]|uniref:anti-sigma factor family protein n=1 Tax=unclassified Azospirillum TaxID=2630922 RepID=UPI000B70F692|nr:MULTISPECIES: hypothetical protein [unclassified Azospirillum]SNS72460.1 Transmembrane transcriptional regulator (anti-sigma factor RsiW) [Azospirillum sp. RU38E]SNS90328.1 Transmembrane transcriptional regulator (anti-sigma factor RsiW) [Azospirillum sp. RU37A]